MAETTIIREGDWTGVNREIRKLGSIRHLQFEAEIADTYVPYVGAIKNVDLGSYDLTTTGTIQAEQLIIDHIEERTTLHGVVCDADFQALTIIGDRYESFETNAKLSWGDVGVVGRAIFTASSLRVTADSEDLIFDVSVDPMTITSSVGNIHIPHKLEIADTGFPTLKTIRTVSATDSVNSSYQLATVSTGDVVDGFGGGIVFSIGDDEAAVGHIATIYAIRDGADRSGALTFNTYLNTVRSERMRIDSVGNIGIGTTAPNAPLEVKGAKPGVVGGHQSGQLQVTGTGAEFYCAVITGHNAFNGNTQLWYLGNTSSSSHNDVAFINRQNAPMHFYTNNTSRMTVDAAGNVGIGTTSPDTKLQVVGTAGFGDDSGNETLFSATGDVSFVGTATVWDDIVLPLDSAKVPAANAPDWESFVGNLNKFAYQVGDFQEFTAELLHGYKEGSSFVFHVHGALNALTAQEEKVQFEIEYSIADADTTDGIGDVFPDGSGSLLTHELVVPNATPDLSNIYMTIGVDTQGTFGVDATIVGRIRRIAKSAGGNELTGNIFVTQVGIHYEQDTVGSRTELTK